MPDDDRCQATTDRPLPSLLQAARDGSPTRYRRCRNRASHTVTVTRVSLAHTSEREMRLCGVHKRVYDQQGGVIS